MLAIYTGASVGTLLPAASNDNDGNSTTSLVSLNVMSNQTYHIAVDGAGGAAGQIVLRLLFHAGQFITRLSDSPRDDVWVPDGPVYALAETNGILYVGGAFEKFYPNNRKADLVDGLSGASEPGFPEVDGVILAVLPDGAGGWFIGGVFTSVGGVPRQNLAHLLSDLSVDLSWNPVAGGPVYALAASTGTLYLGGHFSSVSGVPRKNVAALDPATGGLRSWAPSVTHFNEPFDTNVTSSVYAIAARPNVVYVGGYFTDVGAQSRGSLAAINVVSGDATSWDPEPHFFSLDPFNISPGVVFDLWAENDTVYVAGQFNQLGGQPRSFLGAVDAALGRAVAWNPQPDASVNSVSVFCDTVYVGGVFGFIGGQARNRLAALDRLNGTATSWNPNVGGAAVGRVVPANNVVYVAGHFNTVAGQPRDNVAAVDLATGVPTGWNPGAGARTRALAASGGKVFVAGEHGRGGVVRRNLAALDLRTGAVTDWNPDANRFVVCLAPSGNTIYAGGGFTHVGGQGRTYLASVDARTGLPTGWNPAPNDLPLALAVSESAILVGGQFTQIGGNARRNIAAVDPVTGQATSWNAEANELVWGLTVVGNRVYAAGDFSFIGRSNRNQFAALSLTSGLAAEWDPMVGASGSRQGGAWGAVTLAAHNRIYIGGGFDLFRDEFFGNAVAVDAVEGRPAPWNPVILGSAANVTALALWADTVYAGGSFRTVGGLPRGNLAAIHALSARALPWNPRLASINGGQPVWALSATPSGLSVGGEFSTVGEQARPNLAIFPRVGAPRIELQPRSQTVPVGGAVTLNGLASGDEPLAYQWQFNGVDLPDATAPSLELRNASVEHSGEYTLVVTNHLGLIRSHPAVVTVLQPVQITTQPIGQTVAPGSNVTLSVGVTGNPSPMYQWRLNGVNIPGAFSSWLILTNVQPTNSGLYSIVVIHPGGTVESQVAELIVTTPALPFADNFADRVGTNSLSGVGSGSNVGATREPGEPFHAGKRSGASVWYSWVAPANGIAVFHTRGSSFDTLLAIYTNSVVNQTNVVAIDDDRGRFLTSLVSFNARAGTEYQIAIDGFNGATGRVVLSWSLEITTDELPHIIFGPESQTVGPGDDVIFEVVSVSATPQTYQWFFNCLPIPGATNATLEVSNVQLPRVGIYSVQVSNAVRLVESLPASLQINFSGGAEPKVAARDKLAELLPLTAASAGGFVSVAQGTTGVRAFSTVGSILEPGEPPLCVIGGASQWLQILTETNGILTVSTDGSDFNTILGIYDQWDGSLGGLQQLGCDDNSGRDGEDSLVRITAEAGRTYNVKVDGVNGSSGSVKLTYALDTPSQPMALTRAADGFGMRYQAALGRRYAVEASTNFSRWTTLVTTNLSNSAFWYLDTNAAKYPLRFYRVVPSP